MKCSNCPYIQNNNKHLYCNKFGCNVCYIEHCIEWNKQSEKISKNYSKRKRINKYARYIKYQNHLKHLYKIAGRYYPTPVVYDNEILTKYGYIKNPKPYYKRWYRGKRSSYLKRQSNKAIRRYKGELHNGYQHIHKIYDFWWEYS